MILVRHGESIANVSPVIGGMRGDAGLTATGHRQAELLAERFRVEHFSADLLYASTLPRAQQTAGYLAEVLDLPVQDDAELQEVRVGEADGLSHAEWSSRWPGLAGGLWVNPFQAFATGGESWAAFLARAGAGLTDLVTRHPGRRIVAVTHGGVIQASLAMAFGLGPTATRVGFALSNTGMTTWRHDPSGGDPAWTLVAVNDAGHLQALQRTEQAADVGVDGDRPGYRPGR